jgi:two-component system, OmpR family, flagellar system response regulator FtcR
MTDYHGIIRDLEAAHTSLTIAAAQAMRGLLSNNPQSPQSAFFGRLTVHFDGREPEIDGKAFRLPLQVLFTLRAIAERGKARTSIAHIIHALWGGDKNGGPSDPEMTVYVLIHKLRVALRDRLGFDAIDCNRSVGYLLRSAPPDPHGCSDCKTFTPSPKIVDTGRRDQAAV